MTFPIPKDALDDRLAIVGTAGSGKTYLTLGAVEHLLARKARVIGIDPLGVMWGLRLCADGKTASPFQPIIFGGAHGDLPITEHSGAIVGQAVATSRDSCIIDLSQIGTKAAERRFMLAFLTALYRETDKEPVHLIVDEADMFAPQKLLDKDGDAAKLLGMMETVVRRGRVKGFIPWLITQRPAVLSKDVLSQADGLVALKLTASQDRGAIRAWVESTADQGQWKGLDAKLPTYQRGEGVVWIPARGILTEATFPSKATFDSSRTPKRGERAHTATLKPIDLGALKERLATVEAETKANDPKALKSEIQRLTVENRRLGAAKPSVEGAKVNTTDLRAARAEGQAAGVIEGKAVAVKALGKFARDLSNSIKAAKEGIERSASLMDSYADFIEAMAAEMSVPQSSGNFAKPMQAQVARLTAQPNAKTTPIRQPTGGDASLTNPQAHLLKAMAWWREMGHETPTRAQLAAIAGWKVGGSNLRGRMAELSAAGLIQYPNAKMVALTDAGIAAAPAPDTGTTLMDSIRAMLTNPQRLLFDAMKPGVVHSRETIAAHVGWEPTGSNMRGRLAELSALELIDYPTRGDVALQDWVIQ